MNERVGGVCARALNTEPELCLSYWGIEPSVLKDCFLVYLLTCLDFLFSAGHWMCRYLRVCVVFLRPRELTMLLAGRWSKMAYTLLWRTGLIWNLGFSVCEGWSVCVSSALQCRSLEYLLRSCLLCPLTLHHVKLLKSCWTLLPSLLGKCLDCWACYFLPSFFFGSLMWVWLFCVLLDGHESTYNRAL